MIDLHEGIRALKDGLDSILDGFNHITLFPATDYGEIHREYRKRRKRLGADGRRNGKSWKPFLGTTTPTSIWRPSPMTTVP